jgi:hypothetical protein
LISKICISTKWTNTIKIYRIHLILNLPLFWYFTITYLPVLNLFRLIRGSQKAGESGTDGFYGITGTGPALANGVYSICELGLIVLCLTLLYSLFDFRIVIPSLFCIVSFCLFFSDFISFYLYHLILFFSTRLNSFDLFQSESFHFFYLIAPHIMSCHVTYPMSLYLISLHLLSLYLISSLSILFYSLISIR